MPQCTAAHRTVVQILHRLAGVRTTGREIDGLSIAPVQVIEMQAAEPLQPIEDCVFVRRRAIEGHLDQRHNRHQRLSPVLCLVAASSWARLPLAIFEVTTAARSTSDRKIWMRAISRLALGMSTFSNRLTRWVTRRTAPCMRAMRSRYTCNCSRYVAISFRHTTRSSNQNGVASNA